MLTADEEKRWLVVGICLSKVLTPAIRKIIEQELQTLYQALIHPPTNIHSQTPVSHVNCLPPSGLRLNYININGNIRQTSHHSYDYSVKDEVSLAKLFVKPYMAGFTAFDESLDSSAALSILCGAPNFVYRGIDILAMDVRNDVRNEWGHCKFATWTEGYYLKCFQQMENLIKSLNLPEASETEVLKDLEEWKNQGTDVYLNGKTVDSGDILKEIATLVKSVEENKEIWMQDHAKLQNLRELFLRLEEKHMALEEGFHSLKGQPSVTKSENKTTMAATSGNSCEQDDDSCQQLQEVVERVIGLWNGVVELMPLVFSLAKRQLSSNTGVDFFKSPAMTVHELIQLLFMCMLLLTMNNHLWLCLEGSIIGGQTLSFGLKSDDHQIYRVKGVEFTWEKLHLKNKQDLNFRPINIRGMRYFYNTKSCSFVQLFDERPLKPQIYGAQFLAINSNCTEVYYYDDTDGIWDTYNNATDLHCVDNQATSFLFSAPEGRSRFPTLELLHEIFAKITHRSYCATH